MLISCASSMVVVPSAAMNSTPHAPWALMLVFRSRRRRATAPQLVTGAGSVLSPSAHALVGADSHALKFSHALGTQVTARGWGRWRGGAREDEPMSWAQTAHLNS